MVVITFSPLDLGSEVPTTARPPQAAGHRLFPDPLPRKIRDVAGKGEVACLWIAPLAGGAV
jgi:hypothetical protein